MNTTDSKYEKHLSIIYRKRTPELIIASAVVAIGVIVSYMLFVRDHNVLLYYGDSINHLVISHRVFYSITPGLAQLGAVWLPMTHILLLPFVTNDFLFRTGFAGAIVSILSTAITAVVLFRIVKFQFNSVPAGILASSLYIMNPSVIYMGIIPMMEAPFMMFFMLSVYYMQKWYYIYSAGEDTWKQYRTILKCGFAVSAASLTLYEGWLLPLGLIFFLAIIQLVLFRREGWRYRFEAILLVSIVFGFMGITMWVTWNAVIFKDPLYFATGPYSAQIQADSRGYNEDFKHNPIKISSIIYDVATATYGLPVMIISNLGIAMYLYMGAKAKMLSFGFLTIVMLMLPILYDFAAMIRGSGEIVPSAGGWYNGRYLIFMAPLFAFGTVSLVSYISKNGKKVLTISIVIIVIASYTFTIMSQPLEVGKTAAMRDYYGLVLDISSSKYSASETGIALNKFYEGGNIVLLATSDSGNRIIFSASNVAVKNFIDVTSGHYWQTSKEFPWVYGKYVIRQKQGAVSTTYDPLDDIVAYWEANKSNLIKHYEIIYENKYFEILEKYDIIPRVN
jgi:hypothetical protein